MMFYYYYYYSPTQVPKCFGFYFGFLENSGPQGTFTTTATPMFDANLSYTRSEHTGHTTTVQVSLIKRLDTGEF